MNQKNEENYSIPENNVWLHVQDSVKGKGTHFLKDSKGIPVLGMTPETGLQPKK